MKSRRRTRAVLAHAETKCEGNVHDYEGFKSEETLVTETGIVTQAIFVPAGVRSGVPVTSDLLCIQRAAPK